jgi:uncharacterized protein Yka (UPF0111/DUF47 family)
MLNRGALYKSLVASWPVLFLGSDGVLALSCPPVAVFRAMFSLQALFGKADRFNQLLEASAEEAHESVSFLLQLLKSPDRRRNLDELVLTRRKEKRIALQTSEMLFKSFVTGLDREDIEALSNALYKIPKSVEKFAKRYLLAGDALQAVSFARQAEMMETSTETIVAMVKLLRDVKNLESIKELNERLQFVEGEADKLILELVQDLYSGKHHALQVVILKDLYELMEKAIDRCRDAGNVVLQIALKNS